MLPAVVLNLQTGLTAAPAAAGLTFSGGTPTVAVSSWTQFGSMLLALSLNLTNVSGDVTVSPAAASLSLSGGTPTTLTRGVVAPQGATITLSGGVPVAKVEHYRAPAGASLSLTGGTPSRNIGYSIAPDSGELSLSGGSPTLAYSYTVYPGSGSLGLSGGTPASVWTRGCRSFGPLIILGQNLDSLVGGDVTVQPAKGSLTFVGNAPTAIRSGVEDLPGDELISGSATTDTGSTHGYKNSAFSNPVAFPAAASLSFSGGTPTVINSLRVYPTTAYLMLSGKIPSLKTSYALTGASLTFSGGTPSLTIATPAVAPGAGTLTLSPGTPSLSRGYYNTYGILISGRGFLVKYYDQFGSGVLSALPCSFTYDINRGSQGEGELVAGEASWDANVWELVETEDETWTCQSTSDENWTDVITTTETWTDV